MSASTQRPDRPGRTASDPAPARAPSSRRVAVVLAAGKGTRMRSERPKVLHEAAGRPLLAWVLDAARGAGCDRILVVVGHRAEEVRAAFADADDVTWVEQERQLGTGHALLQADEAVAGDPWLLVLSGDAPLVRPRTLEQLTRAVEEGSWGAMAISTLEDPGSLGRVIPREPVPDAPGAPLRLERIVEASDAAPQQLAVRTVNAGLYVVPASGMFSYLRGLEPDNVKGELYLTDALVDAAEDGHVVRLVELDDPTEAFGVNTPAELERAGHLLACRLH